MNPNATPPKPSPDLESRMARLVGLEDEPQSSHEDSAARQQQMSEPQESQTLAPLSSNPFAKAGLVGAGTLAVVVVAGVFLSQLMNGTHSKPQPKVVPTMTPQATKDPRLQQQAEVEALKTKLALADQANDVKAAQQQLRSEKPPIAVKPTPRPVERPIARERPIVVLPRTPAQPPTIRTVYLRPAVTPQPRVLQPAVPRTYTPPKQLPIVQPIATPTVQPSVAVTPPPKPDPLQEWARLAKLGSYGQAAATDKQSLNNLTAAAKVKTPIALARPTVKATPVDSENQEKPVVSQATQTRRGSKSATKIGTSAKGVLATAVYGETTGNPNQGRNNQYQGRNNSSRNNPNPSSNNPNPSGNDQVFVVQLKEALKAGDGSIALPVGTQVFAKSSYISDKGLVQLDAFKVVWQENGNEKERSVSPDALTIRGAGSKPLVAQEFRKQGGGSRLAGDIAQFALGGVGKIGDVLNLPDQRLVTLNSTSTTNGVNTSTSSTAVLTDPKRSILPALLAGGEKTLVPELSRRTQLSNSRKLQERGNLWYVPANTEVTLFVNQEINF